MHKYKNAILLHLTYSIYTALVTVSTTILICTGSLFIQSTFTATFPVFLTATSVSFFFRTDFIPFISIYMLPASSVFFYHPQESLTLSARHINENRANNLDCIAYHCNYHGCGSRPAVYLHRDIC